MRGRLAQEGLSGDMVGFWAALVNQSTAVLRIYILYGAVGDFSGCSGMNGG